MEKAEKKNERNQVKARVAEHSFNGKAPVLCGNRCLCRCVSPAALQRLWNRSSFNLINKTCRLINTSWCSLCFYHRTKISFSGQLWFLRLFFSSDSSQAASSSYVAHTGKKQLWVGKLPIVNSLVRTKFAFFPKWNSLGCFSVVPKIQNVNQN